MSKVIAAPPTHAAPGPPPAPASPLRRVRRIGYALLGLQLAGLLAWSSILYGRFSLTWDYATYHQAWFLIAHGNLNPYSTLAGLPFWQNDGEFAVWVLAPFYWIWPHDLLLLWLQDVAMVCAEAVALIWMCELAQRYRAGRDAAWFAGAGLVLLLANPWVWWAVSFDFHEETLIIPFAVLAARDLIKGRRRAWVWVAAVLVAGAPTATYVIGLGLGGVLAGRRSRVMGAAMACTGVGYSLLIVLVHADLGVPLAKHYAYLAVGGPPTGYVARNLTLFDLAKGILSHPSGVLRTFWAKRTDVVANLAPAGLLGLGSLMVLPLMLVVLLANILSPGLQFSEPLFQSLPVYIFLPVGTIAVLGWLARRHRRTALLLAGLVAAQALGWAAVWGPQTRGEWLRVPRSTAATLSDIEALIPASAEVVVSQGVSGRLSGRADIETIFGPGTMPVHGETWFVITPLSGIEVQSTASAMAFIGELAGPLHATLVTHANGVWAFRWSPPPGVHTVTVPADTAPLPAWALAPQAAGISVMTGPPGTWHAASTGGQGYVATGLAWQEPPGRYRAVVALSSDGPVKVEVWNDTGHTLLARQSIPETTGTESVVLPVDATTVYRARIFSGWGPFRADFTPPPAGERLEVRVWSPGRETVNVYSAELVPAG